MNAKTIATTALAAALVLAPAAAFAGGSDSKTPYTVDASGITLPEGATFQDHQHINVKTTSNVMYNIHFESRNNQPSGQWIGQSFLPWSAFGIPEGQQCIMWVQSSEFNEHFGEGGQAPVGPDCAGPSDPEDPKTKPTNPPSTPEPSEEPTEEPTENPSPEPTPAPSETVTPAPEPSETPGPVEPAGSDMRPLITLSGAGLIAAGLVTILFRRKKTDQ